MNFFGMTMNDDDDDDDDGKHCLHDDSLRPL